MASHPFNSQLTLGSATAHQKILITHKSALVCAWQRAFVLTFFPSVQRIIIPDHTLVILSLCPFMLLAETRTHAVPSELWRVPRNPSGSTSLRCKRLRPMISDASRFPNLSLRRVQCWGLAFDGWPDVASSRVAPMLYMPFTRDS